MDNSSQHLVVTIGEVHPFPSAKCNVSQTLKILEEAAEVFCAWQDYDGNVSSRLVKYFHNFLMLHISILC